MKSVIRGVCIQFCQMFAPRPSLTYPHISRNNEYSPGDMLVSYWRGDYHGKGGGGGFVIGEGNI